MKILIDSWRMFDRGCWTQYASNKA